MNNSRQVGKLAERSHRLDEFKRNERSFSRIGISRDSYDEMSDEQKYQTPDVDSGIRFGECGQLHNKMLSKSVHIAQSEKSNSREIIRSSNTSYPPEEFQRNDRSLSNFGRNAYSATNYGKRFEKSDQERQSEVNSAIRFGECGQLHNKMLSKSVHIAQSEMSNFREIRKSSEHSYPPDEFHQNDRSLSNFGRNPVSANDKHDRFEKSDQERQSEVNSAIRFGECGQLHNKMLSKSVHIAQSEMSNFREISKSSKHSYPLEEFHQNDRSLSNFGRNPVSANDKHDRFEKSDQERQTPSDVNSCIKFDEGGQLHEKRKLSKSVHIPQSEMSNSREIRKSSKHSYPLEEFQRNDRSLSNFGRNPVSANNYDKHDRFEISDAKSIEMRALHRERYDSKVHDMVDYPKRLNHKKCEMNGETSKHEKFDREYNTGNGSNTQSKPAVYDTPLPTYKFIIPLNRKRLSDGADILNGPDFRFQSTIDDDSSTPCVIQIPINQLIPTQSNGFGDQSQIGSRRKRSNRDSSRFVKRPRKSGITYRCDLQSSPSETSVVNGDDDSSSSSTDDRVFNLTARFERPHSKTDNVEQKSSTSRTFDHKRDYPKVCDTSSNLEYVNDERSGKNIKASENKRSFNKRNTSGADFHFKPAIEDTAYPSYNVRIPHKRVPEELPFNGRVDQLNVTVDGKKSHEDSDCIVKCKREGQTNNRYSFKSSFRPTDNVSDKTFEPDSRHDYQMSKHRISVPEDCIERTEIKSYRIANGSKNKDNSADKITEKVNKHADDNGTLKIPPHLNGNYFRHEVPHQSNLYSVERSDVYRETLKELKFSSSSESDFHPRN